MNNAILHALGVNSKKILPKTIESIIPVSEVNETVTRKDTSVRDKIIFILNKYKEILITFNVSDIVKPLEKERMSYDPTMIRQNVSMALGSLCNAGYIDIIQSRSGRRAARYASNDSDKKSRSEKQYFPNESIDYGFIVGSIGYHIIKIFENDPDKLHTVKTIKEHLNKLIDVNKYSNINSNISVTLLHMKRNGFLDKVNLDDNNFHQYKLKS